MNTLLFSLVIVNWDCGSVFCPKVCKRFFINKYSETLILVVILLLLQLRCIPFSNKILFELNILKLCKFKTSGPKICIQHYILQYILWVCFAVDLAFSLVCSFLLSYFYRLRTNARGRS